MTKWIYLILFSFCIGGFCGETQKKKKVCLNMIVKDESKVIERCLKSVKPLIDYWVIVDTGSTDGTQKIIKSLMKDMPGKLHERPWVNFEHNRNEALKFAKGKGDYVLFIDADEELTYPEGYILPKLDKDYYHFTIDFSSSRYYRIQLINNHLKWKWIGVLHEYLHSLQSKSSGILEGIVNVCRPEGCRSQDPLKFEKDAKILEDALVKEPNNDRYVFYLAQSYRDAGNHEKALENYQKRAAMGGWDQEVFWSKYQAAYMQEMLGKDPDTVIKAYCEAYVERPTRAEPLSRLASYCRTNEQYLMGYLIANLGLSISMPDDILFVENWPYDYWLRFEKSICAYWIGKYDECLVDCVELLKYPNLPENVLSCVKENMKWAGIKSPSFQSLDEEGQKCILSHSDGGEKKPQEG